MNYATIKYYDIANGPGVRTSVFVSGCRHHCPGCFNAVAWDFGTEVKAADDNDMLILCRDIISICKIRIKQTLCRA